MVPDERDAENGSIPAAPAEPDTSRLNDAVEMVDCPILHTEGNSTHIMAVQFDPLPSNSLGVMRCVESRVGTVSAPGFVDRSTLRIVETDSPFSGVTGPPIEIEHSDAVVSGLPETDSHEFLGFEDPILCRVPEDGPLHLYCTIPFYDPSGETVLYLGHASGEDLHSLAMGEPVLGPVEGVHSGAKEPAIAPETSDGVRINLVESSDVLDGTNYSVLRTAIAEDPGEPWEYDELVFHPARDGREWCAGHVSSGPFLPRSFVDVGEGKRVGILNGREANRVNGSTTGFGTFSIGLLIYDYETGTIEWFSEEPFLRDPSARTITFASAFRQIGADRGAIYAHVDDSFIRVYLVDATVLTDFLPIVAA